VDWLAEAAVAYSRADRSVVTADGETVSADGGSNLPAMPLSEELKGVLDGIQARLASIEAERQKPLLARIFGRQG